MGTEVELECEEGFRLVGPETITCGADLSWEPALPFCDKGMCDTGDRRPPATSG